MDAAPGTHRETCGGGASFCVTLVSPSHRNGTAAMGAGTSLWAAHAATAHDRSTLDSCRALPPSPGRRSGRCASAPKLRTALALGTTQLLHTP
jgi:hypothetical protein